MSTGSNRSTAVVIPVKGKHPKGRLSPLLTPTQRRQLQVAMLEDTLQTLIRARMVRDTFIVSSDSQILEFAGRFGANAILEHGDLGVNSAVSLGLERTSRFASRMVIPADLPLLTAADMRKVTWLADEGADVVISPSQSFDGTNLLLLREGAFELHYDDDSFRKHMRMALARGMVTSMYCSRGVGFDIDTPKDVEEFLGSGARGSTLTFLGRTLRGKESLRPRIGSPQGRALRRDV